MLKLFNMKRVNRPLSSSELQANREALDAGSEPPYVQDLGRVTGMGSGLRPYETLAVSLEPGNSYYWR